MQWFFRAGDPIFTRAVATAPFGNGHTVAALGDPGEAAYRYGRIGMPFAAWLLALGHPAAVTWSLVGLHHAAFIALPLLSTTLLEQYGAPAIGGAVVLAIPGLLAIYDRPYAEVVLVALLLATVLAVTTRRVRWAWCLLALAILTKETAAIAIAPMVWYSLRNRRPREAAAWCSALVPYLAWACWVRIRVGDFPVPGTDRVEKRALSFPGGGLRVVLRDKSSSAEIAFLVLATVAVAIAGAWLARPSLLSGYALTFGLFAACAGPSTLRFSGETLRLLSVPQAFVTLSIIVGLWEQRRRDAHRSNVALSGSNAYL